MWYNFSRGYIMEIKKVYTEDIIKDGINKLLSEEFVSLTAVQKYFGVGYSTAGRIIDEMFSKDYFKSEMSDIPFKAKYDKLKKCEIEKYLLNEIKRIKSV